MLIHLRDTARAMSQENVERFHRFLDAFNRQHLAAVLALMDDDVESYSVLVAIEGGYHGHDGVRRLWEDAHNVVPDLTIEAVEVRDLGDLTVANAHLRGHGAGSDVPFDQTLWYVGRWRHGQCVWWGDFRSEAEALEAVGLSE
jgi:ketosteroid isomerase-like protein